MAIAGCGDGDEQSAGPAEEGGGDRVVVAALGDSITAGSPLWDPNPLIRDRIAGLTERSQFEYWAAQERPELEFRNCGVFGERTEQIAARLGGCAEGAEVLVVQGGINDIAQGRPIADAAVNLQAMVRHGRELGLRVALANVLPWNNGWPHAEPRIRELNGLVDAIAADEGVPLLPFHDTLEDPDAPGRMRPEWTSDLDHPSVEGYRRLGELAFRLP